ncbi:conjugative transposon protein TraN [Flavobacterium macacae]|uniref:Conjugative transposon protein TraN n=1 Tax=Flavobacterium macacae TaxID=2488993 RepID=A0A3P3W8P2_9FLAO|nr:conjugative transposon protein TraN [Flavobacterium macacae]RRJ90717.1 conjugative transposon protein TraN [Flavobacterium macacae]
MKTSILRLTALLFVFAATGAQGQNFRQNFTAFPDTLSIAFSKTTNLVFPYGIRSVDRGSLDLLAQKAKGMENILQIKAAHFGFEETNLSVITSDGRLYSFIVTYDEHPAALNFSLARPLRLGQDIFHSPGSLDEAEYKAFSKQALHSRKKGNHSHEKRYEIEMSLDGLFIRGDLMYFRITVHNHSAISYDIDQMRFFVRDAKKAKRTASQEIEILPVHIENDIGTINSDASNTFVFVLPKFTIPEQKYLLVQMVEDNGGRQLEMHVKNKRLAKVVKLPAQ